MRIDNMRRGPVAMLTNVAFQRTDGPIKGPAPPAEREYRMGDVLLPSACFRPQKQPVKASDKPRWDCPGERVGGDEIERALNHADKNDAEPD